MDLIVIVLGLALIGFITYIITSRIPMDPLVQAFIRVFVALVLGLALLRIFKQHIPNVLN